MSATGRDERASNPFAYLRRCVEVSERELACAAGSQRACRDLLEQLANVARPREGAPKVLLILGRLAAENCAWRQGPLGVELLGEGTLSILHIMCGGDAGSLVELFPPMVFDVPLDELAHALDKAPAMIAPLVVQHRSARRIVLTAPGAPVGADPLLSLDDPMWDI